MKDLSTHKAPRYDLPVGPHKNQSFGSARAIKLFVITGAAILCVIVAFLVITSLLSSPGAGREEANLPRFGNLDEMDSVRQPNGNDATAAATANPQEGAQGQQTQQTEGERLSNDLRAQQEMEEQREKILQEQRDAIPSPIGENPPEPVDLSQ